MFRFGENILKNDYLEVRKIITAPHLYKSVSRQTIINASAYATIKWGKKFDYSVICNQLGIRIDE